MAVLICRNNASGATARGVLQSGRAEEAVGKVRPSGRSRKTRKIRCYGCFLVRIARIDNLRCENLPSGRRARGVRAARSILLAQLATLHPSRSQAKPGQGRRPFKEFFQ